MQKGFDKFGHGGLVAKLAGVTFDSAETSVIDNAMCQRSFADTWRAVQEHSWRVSGRGAAYPLEERFVVTAMESVADLGSSNGGALMIIVDDRLCHPLPGSEERSV
jgi:hypothetical protein